LSNRILRTNGTIGDIEEWQQEVIAKIAEAWIDAGREKDDYERLVRAYHDDPLEVDARTQEGLFKGFLEQNIPPIPTVSTTTVTGGQQHNAAAVPTHDHVQSDVIFTPDFTGLVSADYGDSGMGGLVSDEYNSD